MTRVKLFSPLFSQCQKASFTQVCAIYIKMIATQQNIYKHFAANTTEAVEQY